MSGSGHRKETHSLKREGGGRKTVLLAEDTASLRILYAHYLHDAGFRVLQAHDGHIARMLITRGVKIDLLLTDYHMPEMNGIELAQWFHEREPATPVLLLSATLDHVEMASAALPFALCHEKPPRSADFLRLVNLALTHHQPGPGPGEETPRQPA